MSISDFLLQTWKLRINEPAFGVHKEIAILWRTSFVSPSFVYRERVTAARRAFMTLVFRLANFIVRMLKSGRPSSEKC